MIFSSGAVENPKKLKKMKMKQLARNGENGKKQMSGAKRRTMEEQEEDSQKKMCLEVSGPLDSEAEGASLCMAPKAT